MTWWHMIDNLFFSSLWNHHIWFRHCLHLSEGCLRKNLSHWQFHCEMLLHHVLCRNAFGWKKVHNVAGGFAGIQTGVIQNIRQHRRGGGVLAVTCGILWITYGLLKACFGYLLFFSSAKEGLLVSCSHGCTAYHVTKCAFVFPKSVSVSLVFLLLAPQTPLLRVLL